MTWIKVPAARRGDAFPRRQTAAINQPRSPPMLFEVENISCEKCSDKIQSAILATDPTAAVTVRVPQKQVQVEGLLSAEQALSALAAAGYDASEAPPHSGEGSDC